MIRCVRIWTDADGDSVFEDGTIDMAEGARGDVLSATVAAAGLSFRETRAGGSFAWHDAPTRQIVLTLAGTLEFRTRKGERFEIRPGDALLAEDTTGTGHTWRLVGDEPWRRAYVVLAPDAAIPFIRRQD